MPCALPADTTANFALRISAYHRRQVERATTYEVVQQQLESWREEKRLEYPDAEVAPAWLISRVRILCIPIRGPCRGLLYLAERAGSEHMIFTFLNLL